MKNFSIVRNWKIFFAITIIGLMIGYGSMIFRGFNLGIDFTGGSIMDLKFEKAVQVAQASIIWAAPSSSWKAAIPQRRSPRAF